jgi:hypothetical protein
MLVDAAARIRENPFYVLGLRPDASRQVIDREGQKLLGMLALGLKSAATYPTPVGPGERTPEKVREAMAELHRPERRLVHELWARLPATAAGASDDEAADAAPTARADAPWPEALDVFGWSPR